MTEVMETLSPAKQIRGADRALLGAEFAEKYKEGASVRALAEECGRSYGFVHRLLVEHGVKMRAVGGRRKGIPAKA